MIKEQEDLEPYLTEDIYSLLYTANFCSVGYNYAVFIFLFQTALLYLLFFNLFDLSIEDPHQTNHVENRIFIPPGVTIEVRIAQVLSLMLMVMITVNDGDFMNGVTRLVEGYDQNIQKSGATNATCTRWLVTYVLQTCNGIMFLILSYIMTMSSDDVLELFLNITGLVLLQEIDNLGFQIARRGLLGESVLFDCLHVSSIKQFIPPDLKARVRTANRILIMLVSIGLLTAFGIQSVEQQQGKYLCKNVYIQFGDHVYPDYAYQTGIYEIQIASFWKVFSSAAGWGRPFYKSTNDDGSMLQLHWCHSEKAWTFVESEKAGNCNDNYKFKSSSTDSFDVIETADSTWYVRTPAGSVVPVDWLAVVCNDCEHNSDLCKGECIRNKCRRPEQETDEALRGKANNVTRFTIFDNFNWKQGINFEHNESCNVFGTDRSTISSLVGVPGVSFFQKGQFGDDETEAGWTIRIVHNESWVPTLHSRFVYAFFDKWWTKGTLEYWEKEIRAFAVFGGRRWIIFTLLDGETSSLNRRNFMSFLVDSNSTTNPSYALQQFSNSSILEKFEPVLFSSPVNYGTDLVSVGLSDVTWVLAVPKEINANDNRKMLKSRPEDAASIGVRLQCSFCDDANPCRNGGVCVDMWCDCPYFYGGELCEKAVGCSEYPDVGCLSGTCRSSLNICDCDEGYYGNLCQYGPDGLSNLFICKGIICDETAATEDDRHSYCHCNCTNGESHEICDPFEE